MPRIELESLDDPRLAPFRDLKKSNLTRWSGKFIAEGEKLARRLLASPYPVISMLVDRRYADEWTRLARPETHVYVAQDGDVERIVGFNFHRGVLALGQRPPDATLCEWLASAGPAATIVLLAEIHDPGNLGVILRTASALGLKNVMLGPATPDPFSRRVSRTSMGATFALSLYRSNDLLGDLRWLQREGNRELVATTLDPLAEPLRDLPRGDRQEGPAPKRVIVFGCEGHGLPENIQITCDRRVTIPMAPGVDSLNVAVAAGIILNHFRGE